MSLRRYSRTPTIRGGRQYGTAQSARAIYNAVQLGTISVDVRIVQEGERLDSIAGEIYGDGRLWWVIAAASGIGWGAQVPPGTVLKVPRTISQVSAVIG